jgi:hypothetical protein
VNIPHQSGSKIISTILQDFANLWMPDHSLLHTMVFYWFAINTCSTNWLRFEIFGVISLHGFLPLMSYQHSAKRNKTKYLYHTLWVDMSFIMSRFTQLYIFNYMYTAYTLGGFINTIIWVWQENLFHEQRKDNWIKTLILSNSSIVTLLLPTRLQYLQKLKLCTRPKKNQKWSLTLKRIV